jgi:hypothetical protein
LWECEIESENADVKVDNVTNNIKVHVQELQWKCNDSPEEIHESSRCCSLGSKHSLEKPDWNSEHCVESVNNDGVPVPLPDSAEVGGKPGGELESAGVHEQELLGGACVEEHIGGGLEGVDIELEYLPVDFDGGPLEGE